MSDIMTRDLVWGGNSVMWERRSWVILSRVRASACQAVWSSAKGYPGMLGGISIR